MLLDEAGRTVLRVNLTTFEDDEFEEFSALGDFELPPSALRPAPAQGQVP
ncbi:MAG TPA: hypothetical protein VF815_35170 [Myxococcaceae bacterium]